MTNPLRRWVSRHIAQRAFDALSTFAHNLDGKTYTMHQSTIVTMLDILREHIDPR